MHSSETNKPFPPIIWFLVQSMGELVTVYFISTSTSPSAPSVSIMYKAYPVVPQSSSLIS